MSAEFITAALHSMRIRTLTAIIAILATATFTTNAYATLDSGLPNPKLTPGFANPAVTQRTIGSTICVVGYTKTIRPSAYYTTSLKKKQLASGYNYQGDLSTADYEEDHLLPLEIGGHPTDARNLWPEPRLVPRSAGLKDKLENKIHLLICSGKISLIVGQSAFTVNWEKAYESYIGKLPD